MYRTALSFRLSQAMYHDGCQIRHVKWYNINGICSRHRLILNKQLTSVSNSPCLIHNLGYVYVSTVLEPPLLSLFWALICKHFFFFVSKREKKKPLETINTHWAWWIGIISSQTQRKMYKRRKKIFHLNAYINTCKTKNKRKNLYRHSQTKPNVEF